MDLIATPPPVVGSRVRPDALVLGKRPLRRDTARRTTSRFVDDVWDLTPAVLQDTANCLRIRFSTLPAVFRPVAKDLFFALLAHKPPPGLNELTVTTIHGLFGAARAFLTWAQTMGAASISGVTPDLLRRYNHDLIAQGGSIERRDHKRRAVRLFWLYRDALPEGDRLALDPLLVDDWIEGGAGRRGRENTTPRIPEAVMGPLLVWALRFVHDFSDNIFAGLAEWTALHTRRHCQTSSDGRGARDRLTVLLDRYRAADRPLPGGTSGPRGLSMRHLAREIGCSQRSVLEPGARQLVDATADIVGVADDAYLWTAFDAPLDDRPWQDSVAATEVQNLVRLLHAAAYIVIAYLSGMRDSEVKHLRRGCLSRETDSTGRISRCRVTSQTFKGEGSPWGVEATWIVGAPVAKAIEVLERLQGPRQKRLFAIPPTSRHFHRTNRRAKTVTSTNTDLRYFIQWINTYCAARGRLDGIPLVSGRQWILRTSQFRRTLAWFIARRPGGTIAGAIQYRHLSIQMFEGYAGTSRSGFRAEAQQEQALARGERLAAMVDGHEHQRLHGPAAAETAARLEKFGDRIRFLGKTPDEAQLRKLMKRSDPRIYPGTFVTCSDNPDRRLCRPPADRAQAPALNSCQPLACNNAAFTEDNRTAWHHRLALLDAQLARGHILAPLVRDRLARHRDEIASLLGHPTPAPDQQART